GLRAARRDREEGGPAPQEAERHRGGTDREGGGEPVPARPAAGAGAERGPVPGSLRPRLAGRDRGRHPHRARDAGARVERGAVRLTRRRATGPPARASDRAGGLAVTLVLT